MCISDFDGDGKNDLASANYGAIGSISVFRNTSTIGTVSFAPKIDYSCESGPWRILSTDVDGDGKKDIAILNGIGTGISVFKNTSIIGTISFSPKSDYTLTQQGYALAEADFNNDGKTDFVAGNNSGISVIVNKSVVNNVSLAAPLNFNLQGGFLTIAVSAGDVDGDNKPDIVFLNRDSIYVMKNITVGSAVSFAPAISYATKIDNEFLIGPTDILICDLDGDSKPEIAVANTAASQSISIFKNNSVPGTISFPARNDFLTGDIQPLHLGAEDLDGDGKIDIPFLHEYVPRTVSVIKNISIAGTIAFSNHVDFTDNGNGQLAGICTGDLDGDGKPEIITTGSNSLPSSIYIYKNKTDGPHVTSFSPTNGIEGTSITITGSNFNGTTSVSFGGVAATSFTVNSSTKITAIVGNGASGNVTVTTSLGTGDAPGFNYGLLPTITSFSPASGATLASITITGTNFTGATEVNFGGELAASFTVNSSTSITAIVWLGASGSVSVTVPGGTASLPGFTYIPPAPVINSFSPQNGGAGTLVTISGSNFFGTTDVSFGGISASSFTLYGPSLTTAIVDSGGHRSSQRYYFRRHRIIAGFCI